MLVLLEEREPMQHEDRPSVVKWLASVCVAVSHCSTKNPSQVVLAAMRQDRSALLYASQELRRDKVGEVLMEPIHPKVLVGSSSLGGGFYSSSHKIMVLLEKWVYLQY